MEKLWTATEVAKYLGINEQDVDALVRDGRLTGYKLGGEFLRFRPDQVEALKPAVAEGAMPAATAAAPTWMDQAKEFLYFNDFYIISAGLLIALVGYLISLG